MSCGMCAQIFLYPAYIGNLFQITVHTLIAQYWQ